MGKIDRSPDPIIAAFDSLQELTAVIPMVERDIAIILSEIEIGNGTAKGIEAAITIEGLSGSNEAARKEDLAKRLGSDPRYQDAQLRIGANESTIIELRSTLSRYTHEWTALRLQIEYATSVNYVQAGKERIK